MGEIKRYNPNEDQEFKDKPILDIELESVSETQSPSPNLESRTDDILNAESQYSTGIPAEIDLQPTESQKAELSGVSDERCKKLLEFYIKRIGELDSFYRTKLASLRGSARQTQIEKIKEVYGEFVQKAKAMQKPYRQKEIGASLNQLGIQYTKLKIDFGF